MLIIGLTGGIGSGKTTVANLFAEKGIKVIDTDQLSRDLTRPGQPALKQIIDKFGSDILNADGTLNRSELRKRIFTDARDRIWLEKLLHPLIREEMRHQTEAAKSPYCIVVIPLLFETEPNPLINRILVIDAFPEHQIKRTQVRDNTSQEAIEAILKTQVAREHRLENSDDVIHNHGVMSDLIAQVDELHKRYMKLTKSL